MRPQMAARPLHLFEAGVVTEQRFAGLASAPVALAEAFQRDLSPEKQVRVPFNPRDRWLTAARESCRTLADAITVSLRAGALCGVLGGECTLVAGTLSGALAAEPDLLLVYVDEHDDIGPVLAFARRKRVWLHVDVDVLDAAAMPAVVFPAPGGASLAALTDL